MTPPYLRQVCVVLLVLLSFGCAPATTTKNTPTITPKGAIFSIKPHPEGMLFQDARSALRFCVPRGTKLMTSRSFRPSNQGSFEVRMVLAPLPIEVLLRRDPLPSDLPEGALSAPWLLRYAEIYAQHRGAAGLRKQILPRRQSHYLRVDAAVWMAFQLPSSQTHPWEELLVLSRQEPPTRYLLTIRMGQKARTQPGQVRRFLRSLLQHLRMGS